MTTLRTSWGIRCQAALALSKTLSKANSACHFGAKQSTNPSSSVNLSAFLTLSTLLISMPYAGSSSEWNTPLTPANFAAPASSLPSLGN